MRVTSAIVLPLTNTAQALAPKPPPPARLARLHTEIATIKVAGGVGIGLMEVAFDVPDDAFVTHPPGAAVEAPFLAPADRGMWAPRRR